MTRNHTQKVRALCLLSGGLDSILAARVLMDQNIETWALTFISPFFSADKGEKGAKMLGLPLKIVDITERYIPLLLSPRYGFGANMNPCIDCHTLMVNIAGEIMEAEGFDLIATGEVLGERAMSQNRQSLLNVARNSGYEHYLLRPLSALLLEPTKPELDGLVQRTQLYSIAGKSRKPQIALARKFGISEYPQPAGGCLLTDRNFSKRLKELLKYTSPPSQLDLELLSIGRHFRLQSGVKAIIARNSKESLMLWDMNRPGALRLTLEPLKGPVGLLPYGGSEEDIQQTAVLCIHFSRYRHQTIPIRVAGSEIQRIVTPPELSFPDLDKLKIN